jgi:hypothetical protein
MVDFVTAYTDQPDDHRGDCIDENGELKKLEDWKIKKLKNWKYLNCRPYV